VHATDATTSNAHAAGTHIDLVSSSAIAGERVRRSALAGVASGSLDTRNLSIIVDTIMLVAPVAVVSFAVLMVLPPVLLALALRVFTAPTSSREMPCRPATQPALAASH